jgi:hypothetical protein
MPIAGYTTTVQVSGTLDKITKMLTKAKVRGIQTEYGDHGDPTALVFRLDTPWGERQYALPINAEGVRQTLIRDRVEKRYQTIEQANRVAWRIAHDWLRAQLAIIDAGMVTLPEVMFPYLILGADDKNRPVTAFQRYADTQKEISA